MARNITLVKLLDDLRVEIRASLNPAHNVQMRDPHVKMLQRSQEVLWEDFAWPHLRVYRPINLEAGQRYYDFPEDIDVDRIVEVEVWHDSRLCPLHPGVDRSHLSLYNSDLEVRQWPPQRWQISEDNTQALGQMEIWPIPSRNADEDTLDGVVRVTAIRKLNPLVEENDRSDLDGRLIVLYAAAEILASQGAKDAQLKLNRANKLFAKLRGGLMPRKTMRLFSSGGYERTRRVPIAIYNKPSP